MELETGPSWHGSEADKRPERSDCNGFPSDRQYLPRDRVLDPAQFVFNDLGDPDGTEKGLVAAAMIDNWENVSDVFPCLGARHHYTAGGATPATMCREPAVPGLVFYVV